MQLITSLVLLSVSSLKEAAERKMEKAEYYFSLFTNVLHNKNVADWLNISIARHIRNWISSNSSVNVACVEAALLVEE